jgi:hypothetical protein
MWRVEKGSKWKKKSFYYLPYKKDNAFSRAEIISLLKHMAHYRAHLRELVFWQ